MREDFDNFFPNNCIAPDNMKVSLTSTTLTNDLGLNSCCTLQNWTAEVSDLWPWPSCCCTLQNLTVLRSEQCVLQPLSSTLRQWTGVSFSGGNRIKAEFKVCFITRQGDFTWFIWILTMGFVLKNLWNWNEFCLKKPHWKWVLYWKTVDNDICLEKALNLCWMSLKNPLVHLAHLGPKCPIFWIVQEFH